MRDMYDTSLRFAYEVLSAAKAACHASGMMCLQHSQRVLYTQKYKTVIVWHEMSAGSLEEARRTKCK